MRRTVFVRALLALAILLLAPASSFAQTQFATITGSLTDPSGLPLAGAKIAGVQVESGYHYDAQSNESGDYTLANLREGTYNVTVTAAGFKEFHAQGIVLASREIRRQDVKMEVGSI